MLEVRDLSVSYKGIPALRRVSLDVKQGEVVSVLGPNGAGKTTLLNAISGLVKPEADSSIRFVGKELVGQTPDVVVEAGVVQVPEGRQIFAELTVLENMEVGAVRRRDRKGIAKDIADMFDIFPELRGREKQYGGTLSGGEQQMLAIARALVAAPKLIMIDEPSMGLAPVVVQRIFRLIRDVITKRGVTVLLVEQNTALSFAVSDRAYILTQGSVAMQGTVEELSRDQRVKETYFRGRGGNQ
ncbi:MAG: High-affinity branched-chain amino acid transport ATP-binding protein LivF [Firmicutes bacterium ADurb.Bin506]|nr:MAG: High-affinity branched-chain amino acid transport ATP-binding protein LivF [Firmicutes bacterium ADurb.Bin506]